MPFQKGKPRPENAGRKKGTPNKVSVSAKEAFQRAFDENGGCERLVEWIKEDVENEKVFYQIYSKLFPIEMRGDMTGKIEVTWVKPKLDYDRDPLLAEGGIRTISRA